VDEYSSIVLHKAIIDIFAYCYLGTYNSHICDTGTTFDVRVLSHLITHTIALLLEMPGLAALVEEHFKAAFAQYCTSSADGAVEAALKHYFSRVFLDNCWLGDDSATLLVTVAFKEFKRRVEAYKKEGRVMQVLQLMDAIPNAAAEMYGQTTRETGGEREAVESKQFEEQDNNSNDQQYTEGEDEEEDGSDVEAGVSAQLEREAQQEELAE